jgi:hypothetical protein
MIPATSSINWSRNDTCMYSSLMWSKSKLLCCFPPLRWSIFAAWETSRRGCIRCQKESTTRMRSVTDTHSLIVSSNVLSKGLHCIISTYLTYLKSFWTLQIGLSCPSLFVAVKSPAFPQCLSWPNCPRLQGHLPAATPMNSPSQQPQRTWLDDGSYLKMPAVRWWSNYGLIAIFSYYYYSIHYWNCMKLYNLLFLLIIILICLVDVISPQETQKIQTTAYSRLHVLRNHLVPHQSAKAT